LSLKTHSLKDEVTAATIHWTDEALARKLPLGGARLSSSRQSAGQTLAQSPAGALLSQGAMTDKDQQRTAPLDGRSYKPDPTESYVEYVARLRADLAALKAEQASPITPERYGLVKKWIELIERELKEIGEAPT
jgi:hypothetical protein